MPADTREPLRLGVLGAARIAPLSLFTPAAITGDRIVAVAARSPARAAAYAAEHGIERVAASYEDLIADPQVEAIYDPLANGLHGGWNLRVLAAGKHLLTEKPSAANAEQAREVAAMVEGTGQVFLEGFHYPYHPLFQRAVSLAVDGAIGEIVHIDVPLLMPDPGADDPRWSLSLAGGSGMDLGCYSLSCLHLLGSALCGGSFAVQTARTTQRDGAPGVDETLAFTGVFPSGATGSGGSSMVASEQSFTLVITGTAGEIVVPNFPLPNQDDRLILRAGTSNVSPPRKRTAPGDADDLLAERDGDVVEHLGTRSTYTYQLEAFGAAVRNGAPVITDAAFSVRVMELVDAAYEHAGLPLRPATPVS
ncbi:MAG: Gfo/Idh/MocA family protein [Nostocoides sp.]